MLIAIILGSIGYFMHKRDLRNNEMAHEDDAPVVPTNNVFDDLIREFSLYKHKYNVQELQRVKTRAAQILGFLLIVTSIIFTGITAFALEEIKNNFLALGILIFGMILLAGTMLWCYGIMIRQDQDPIIDPQELFTHFRNVPLEETREVLRDTMFDILNQMDVRNTARHAEMLKIYWMALSSLVIIFIPMIQASISILND